jgi:hypothetical protein
MRSDDPGEFEDQGIQEFILHQSKLQCRGKCKLRKSSKKQRLEENYFETFCSSMGLDCIIRLDFPKPNQNKNQSVMGQGDW